MRAADYIAENNRQRILSGELAGGRGLPSERVLAEGYSVSVNTVREAVRALTVLGLVDAFEIEKASLSSVLELGRALLSRAAELAVERAHTDQISQVESAVAAIDTAPDPALVAKEVTRFREALVDAAGDPLFSSLYRLVSQLALTTDVSERELNPPCL